MELNKFQKVIYDIASRVYENLGPGHSEKVYQKAMSCELNCNNILHDLERHISIKYIDSKNNVHILESERIDILIHKNNEINNYVVIELKAINKTMQEPQSVQVNKYFKELKKENIIPNYGILINFPQPNHKETRKIIDFKIIKNNITQIILIILITLIILIFSINSMHLLIRTIANKSTS